MPFQEYRNRFVGVVNLLYGGAGTLLGVAMIAFFLLQVVTGEQARLEKLDVTIIIKAKFIIALIVLFVTSPSLLTGYGLLRQRSWARNSGIFASLMALLNFPFGTAVGIYTLFFLLSEDARDLYNGSAVGADCLLHVIPRYYSSVPATSQWYVPPREMPNWRG